MLRRLLRQAAPRSTALHLSLRYSALYTAVTLLVFAFAYVETRREVSEMLGDQLEGEAEILRERYQDLGLPGVVGTLEVMVSLNARGSRFALFVGPEGERLYANTPLTPEEAPGRFIDKAKAQVVSSDEEMSGYELRRVHLGPNLLILGVGDHMRMEILEALAAALAVGFGLIAATGLIFGLSIGRRTERRLREIDRTLTAVGRGAIGLRIPEAPRQTSELLRLSGSINATLGELEKLMETQKRISADIAHDLKTPLQRLRQRLERFGLGFAPESPEAMEIEQALESVDHLMSVFQAILRIAEIEDHRRRARFAPVDLAELAARVHDAYEPVAEEKGQILRLKLPERAAWIFGDGELIAQAAVNAVENGLRHCPPGSEIELEVGEAEGAPVLRVSDDGPGVPPEEVGKVFDKFHRVERSRTTPGNGLGLALVKAVADLHEARVGLENLHPGLRLEIRFPPPEPARTTQRGTT
ncbi:HAMP domain-containing sensor histidine kinase [Neomegalonema sp.]|uniref:sensor histidine kinase n=1 Tax=Neomegalonema sp. TaxID=2039713 RepID=UPI00260BA9BB|nr:HAMP domain-containing sensor histidine kinase [Neomegalonema sp.]MDD2867824.1 HAMP domain-containing sensor histidine kinase [Neomegalonema sp.]